MSEQAIMATPRNETIRPKKAKREGFSPGIKTEISKDQIGVVFTKTVALIIVVSITADAKSTKCNRNKIAKKTV